MKYCVNCGNQLNDADKFCGQCGTAVPVIQAEQTMPPIPPVPSAGVEASDMPPIPKTAEPKSSDASGKNKNVMPAVNEEEHKKEREAELKKNIGTVRKCPYCGFNKVPLFAIGCPKCKREFNSTKVDDSVKKFFEKLMTLSDGYEYESDKDKSEFFMIGKAMLFTLSILCFLFGVNSEEAFHADLGGPLFLVGFVLIVIGICMKKPLSRQELEKRNYIETFVIPNNKESIIEFLIWLYHKSKVEAILLQRKVRELRCGIKSGRQKSGRQ